MKMKTHCYAQENYIRNMPQLGSCVRLAKGLTATQYIRPVVMRLIK
jgi:hypothetical protein